MLPNMVIYRMSMVPRSYDERVYTEVHEKGFKLASNSIGEFGSTSAEFLTLLGKDQLERSVHTFNDHCEKHRLREIWEKENKRQILANKVEPRWAYSSNYGSDLSNFVSDPNYLFKKTIGPLNPKEGQLQADAFKRTSIRGSVFRQEVSSII